MANFIEAIAQLLGMGGNNPQLAQGAAMAGPAPAPQPVRGQLPRQAPVPVARPDPATLSPAPTAPVPMPTPAPRPQAPQPQPQAVPQPQAGPQTTVALAQGPLGALFGGKDLRGVMRGIGAGMANLGNTGGDPYVSFGRGFGGATSSFDVKDVAAAKAAADAEQLRYGRGRDAQGDERQARLDDEKRKNDAADLELRRLSEKRQAESSDLQNQKTAAEIKRDARLNGITTSQMLEIERIAQAAGENLFGAKREQAIKETRDRLIEQVKTGSGLTDQGAGLSQGGGITATGPNGEKIMLRNGKWEPM